MTPKQLPASEPFFRALRERDYNSIAFHYRLAFDKMSALASLHESPERKPAFYEKTPDARTVPEVDAHMCEAYVVTAGAHYWKWNCGWWEVDPTTRKTIGSPIGHLAFRRKPVVDTTDLHFLRRPRPFGLWRRVIKDYLAHPLFGNVRVEATDGIIAIIIVPAVVDTEGKILHKEYKTDCMYANLTEIGVATERKLKRIDSGEVKPKKPTEQKLKKSLFDLL